MSALKNNPLIKGENGPSGTKLFYSIFAAIVCLKFLLAGVTAFGMTFGDFDTSGAATLLGVFSLTYAGRRYTEANRPKTGGDSS